MVGSVNEVLTDTLTNTTNIGTLSSLNTTTKSSLVGSINETYNWVVGIGTLSNLTTITHSNAVSAINEVNAKANTNTSYIGTVANLETSAKTDLVSAINEVFETSLAFSIVFG